MPTTKEMIQDAKMKAEVEVQNYAQMEAQLDLDLKAAEDKGYDLAKTDMNVPADSKIYTEADLQAEKKILQDQIDAQKTQLDSAAQAQADAVAAAKKDLAVATAKKIRDAQIDNDLVASDLEQMAQA